MELVISLVLATALPLVFRDPIKKHPVVFYALAILADLVFLSRVLQVISPVADRALYPYMQRCLFSYGLFVVIMFIGALPSRSALRRRLSPVRGELSIIAAILAMGHIANYAGTYAASLAQDLKSLPESTTFSLAISSILLILLSILTVTSFERIRRSMAPASWKRLQRLAYPFFILIAVHLALLLAPAVSSFDQKAFFSVVVYTVITLAYVALRYSKAMADRRQTRPSEPQNAWRDAPTEFRSVT